MWFGDFNLGRKMSMWEDFLSGAVHFVVRKITHPEAEEQAEDKVL